MTFGRRLFTGSLWCALDGWATEIANLAIFLVMVRLLGPAEFGLIALALVFTSIGTELLGYSVSQVLVQRSELPARLTATVFWLIAGLLAALTAVLVTAAPLVAALFGAPELAGLLRWLCIAAVLHGLAAVPLALLSRDLRFDVIAKRSLAMIVVGGAVGIPMAMAGAGAMALVALHLVQGVVSAVILFGATRFVPLMAFDRAHLQAVRRYVLGVVGNRMVGLFDERAAQVAIGLVLGPAAVGYYNVAMRLIDILIRMFVVPVNQVAMPAIARVQAEPARVRGILDRGIEAASIVSVPAFVGTAVVAPELVPIALGETWLPTVLVLQLLCLRGLVWPVLLYGQSLLYGLGQPERMLRINLVDLVVNVLTLAIAAPFGLGAVALVSGLRILLLRWPLVGRAIAEVAGVPLAQQTALVGRALIAGLLMGAILLVLQQYLALRFAPLPVLSLLIAAGCVLYPIILCAMHPRLTRTLKVLLRRHRRRLRPAARAPRPLRGGLATESGSER